MWNAHNNHKETKQQTLATTRASRYDRPTRTTLLRDAKDVAAPTKGLRVRTDLPAPSCRRTLNQEIGYRGLDKNRCRGRGSEAAGEGRSTDWQKIHAMQRPFEWRRHRWGRPTGALFGRADGPPKRAKGDAGGLSRVLC